MAVDLAEIPRILEAEERSALREAQAGTSAVAGTRTGAVVRLGSVHAPLISFDDGADDPSLVEDAGGPRTSRTAASELMKKMQSIEHNATFQQAASRLMELSLLPTLRMIQDRLRQGRQQERQLRCVRGGTPDECVR